MPAHIEQSTRYYRYELVHDDYADFIAYQRHQEDGSWQTLSTWMIPQFTSD
jgi:hypothetical protein